MKFENTTLPILIAVVAANATISLPYEANITHLNAATESALVSSYCQRDVSDWNQQFKTNIPDQLVHSTDNRLSAILEFSEKLLKHSTDIDKEFVKLVNENFWDLM